MKDKKWDIARMIHAAEIFWIFAWLALGVVVLLGTNQSFDTSHGERNIWQIVFGFLP